MITFLDVDGVLNSRAFYERRKVETEEEMRMRVKEEREEGLIGASSIDSLAVAHLNTIITKGAIGSGQNGVRIVVSSTWRLGRTVAELTAILRKRGLCDEARIIGTTPSLRMEHQGEFQFDVDEVAKRRVHRGLEIQSWISNAGYNGAFVILDDDQDMAHLARWHVHTPHDTGLTEELAKKAIQILQSHRREP